MVLSGEVWPTNKAPALSHSHEHLSQTTTTWVKSRGLVGETQSSIQVLQGTRQCVCLRNCPSVPQCFTTSTSNVCDPRPSDTEVAVGNVR